MATDFADRPLFEFTADVPPVPLAPAIAEARAVATDVARTLLAIPDGFLDEPWQWERGEIELRYAFYRCFELFEAAEAAVRGAVAAAGAGSGPSRAAQLIGPATAACWDLKALLMPLGDEIDADPGGGEWTIRRTLGHLVNGQRAYGWGGAWWQAQAFAADDPAIPPGAPESIIDSLPDEEADEAAGSLDEIVGRLDAILDLGSERLAGLPDERLDRGARWSGLPVDIAFRLGRWSSHIREHTIQVDKTLAMIGRAPTEAERMVRVVLAAYGRAEAIVFARPEAEIGRATTVLLGAAQRAQATAVAARAAADERAGSAG